MSDAATVLAALQTLTQAGLTAMQVTHLLNMPERTEADVQAQLDATDATIRRLKDED
jgi:hypothetical protein